MKKRIIGMVFVVAACAVLFSVTKNPESPAPKAAQKTYVALGDSVAAGVGLKYDTDSSACDRTDQSYPHVLANAENLKLTNLACTGASIPAGVLGNLEVNKLSLEPQFDKLLTIKNPGLITITIGANDVQWTRFLTKCYTAVCGAPEDTAINNNETQTLSANLAKLFSKLRSQYKDQTPKIIITNYYQLFPETIAQACTEASGLDASEVTWLRSQQSTLSEAISSTVANFNFVTLAPVDFSGHELCTSDPWIQGLTAKQPYHPTADGQKAMAAQIRKTLKL